MIELFQIYYYENHLQKLFPFSVPYKNEGLTIYFENDPIVKLVKASKADKIGVCSWKLADKMRQRVGLRKPLTKQDLESDYQVLSFTKNSSRHQMLAMAYHWHKDFKETFGKLWTKLGYREPREVKNPVYQNSYVAQTEIYRDYVDNFLIPAMELTEKDEEMHELMRKPSGYGRLNRNADVKRVRDILGMTDYPLAPFILERCPSVYYELKGYKISYL